MNLFLINWKFENIHVKSLKVSHIQNFEDVWTAVNDISTTPKSTYLNLAALEQCALIEILQKSYARLNNRELYTI